MEGTGGGSGVTSVLKPEDQEDTITGRDTRNGGGTE